MEEIIVLPQVQEKLIKLVDILFYKDYFGFIENAFKYVQKLENFIYTIPRQHKQSTTNRRFGAWYCTFKPNKHTHWYITFDTDGELYIIRNILNNHTEDYPTFIKGLKD